MKLIHATCVRVKNAGFLLTGPSGSGKSDLALRLILKGARLVGDDYVHVGAEAGALYAAAPPEIAGKLEVRGLGIFEPGYVRVSRVAAVVELAGEGIERLPPPRTTMIDGVTLPCFRINPFEASACEKLLMLIQGLLPSDTFRTSKFGDSGFGG